MKRPPPRRSKSSRKRRCLAICTAALLLIIFLHLSLAPTRDDADLVIPPDEPNSTRPLPFPLGVQPWSAEAVPYLSFTSEDDAALNILPRPGESFVSNADFFRCLADRLNVDVATRTQRPLLDPESTTPLIAFPMMIELADHRALMCNMTNHIRYVMYVDNGGVPEVGRFLADVEAAFGWTDRVAVRRYPWNAGFSAAVNSAIDWALQLPADEVPFLHVSNNDVRYPPGLYEDRIRDMHQLTRGDNARIKELEAEVAAEAAVPESFAHYRDGKPLRMAWSVNASLVTSALLPERVRYMHYMQRKKQFTNHTGILFFRYERDFSSFLLSRLTALTVGYFDENFYPAYFEDIDYYWRVNMLGFQLNFCSKHQPEFVHLVNAIYKITDVVDSGAPRRFPRQVVAWTKWFNRVREVMPSYQYAMAKWGTMNWGLDTGGMGRYSEPFAPASRWDTGLSSHRAKLHTQVRMAMLSRQPSVTLTRSAEAHVESVVSDMARKYLRDAIQHTFNNKATIPLDAWVRDENAAQLVLNYGYAQGGVQSFSLRRPFYRVSLVRDLFRPKN